MHGSWLSIRVMDTRHSLTLREDGPDGIIAPAFSLSATGEASDSYSSFLFILTIPAQVSGSRVRCLLKFCLGILACFTLVYFLPGRPFKTWPLRGPEGRFFLVVIMSLFPQVLALSFLTRNCQAGTIPVAQGFL